MSTLQRRFSCETPSIVGSVKDELLRMRPLNSLNPRRFIDELAFDVKASDDFTRQSR